MTAIVIARPGPSKGDQRDREHQERQGENGVHEPGQHGVDEPCDITGGQPDQQPDRTGQPGCHDADEQGDPGAVDHPEEDVPAQIIRAEEEPRPRPDRDALRGDPGAAELRIGAVARGCARSPARRRRAARSGR